MIDHASSIILDHGRSLDPSHISRKVPTSPDLPERENLKWLKTPAATEFELMSTNDITSTTPAPIGRVRRYPVPVGINLNTDDHAELAAEAHVEDVPVAVMARRLIKDALHLRRVQRQAA